VNSVQINQEPTDSAVDSEHASAFAALGRFVARRSRLVLVTGLVALLIAGALGSGLFARLGAQGFDDPGSESAAASRVLADTFGVSDPVAVLAIETPTGIDADAAAATAIVTKVSAIPDVSEVISYWTSGKPDTLKGSDGKTGQVLVFSKITDEAKQSVIAKAITDQVGGEQAGLQVYVGGFSAVSNELTDVITKDLARAESIAIPITVVLLIFVFGSLVSAGLPFAVALFSILGSFFFVWLVSLVTDVSVFALNLITGLGLGLGIDYALLVVNRFREELAHGRDVPAAVERTVATAGRTVFVSGLTVAIVLGSLLFFPHYFLKSFGYAGIAVTLIAMVAAITVLPALLAMLGHRVDRFKVRRGNLAPTDEGMWSRVARFTMARPWPVLVIVLGALLFIASPALNVTLGQTDARALPADNPAAVASQILTERFPGQEGTPVDIVVPGKASDTQALADYATDLSKVSTIVRVVGPTGVYIAGSKVAPTPEGQPFVAGADARISLVSSVPPRGVEGIEVVDNVRAVPAPTPARLVGGMAAEYADSQRALSSFGVWALLWIAVATLIVLFLYTGSVLLPLKAVALNVLSLGATLGALVYVFQEGHLKWLVGDFTVTGTIDTSSMILIAVVAFALSMDYEVFLLSRIKEEHDLGKDTTSAVALGLQRSGRIITAAAVLLAVVFASFVTSGVTNIKQLGFGVAFAILLDATIVRGLLVPAFMRLAGRWNWWAPAPLAAFHRRFGISD